MVVVLSWTGIALAAILPVLPFSPVTTRVRAPAVVRAVLPEGWAFFTRDAREARMFVRAWRGGAWVPLTRAPHGEPRNRFGFDRTSRAQGVEAGLLLARVPSGAWRACRGTDAACATAAGAALSLRNTSPSPTLCGDIMVVMRPPVPWAWSRLMEETGMRAHALRVRVTC
jgi:antimicrobial peptide system SdpA family protein